MGPIAKRLRYYLGLLALFARYSLMEQMEYRINFIAGIVVECGYMLIKLMYVVLILNAGADINGLSANEMLMCIGTYILVTGVYMGVYPNFWALPLRVRDGSLDMLLTKPVNTQFLVTLRKLDFGMPLPDVACGRGADRLGLAARGAGRHVYKRGRVCRAVPGGAVFDLLPVFDPGAAVVLVRCGQRHAGAVLGRV